MEDLVDLIRRMEAMSLEDFATELAKYKDTLGDSFEEKFLEAINAVAAEKGRPPMTLEDFGTFKLILARKLTKGG